MKAIQINVKSDKIFSLEQVPQAHTHLESEQAFGKLVVLNK